jgi:ABC-type glycerol-3-phosphate transport system permease component
MKAINPIKIIKSTLFYVFVIIVCFAIISPFIMMIMYSLRTSTEMYSLNIRFFPRNPTAIAYKNAIFNYEIAESTFQTWATNSLIVCGISTFIAIFCAAMCGYALSRYRYYGKTIMWWIIVLTQSLPWIVLLIPFYMIFSGMGYSNNRAILALSYITVFVPISTWLFSGFFKNISTDIEDAAKIDGCNNWNIFFKIVLPLSISAVSAIALFTFVVGWGDFLFASVFIKTADNWTLPLGLVSFRGQYDIEWAEIMAVSTIITIPIVVLFIYLQKHLINLMSGGVKE